MSMSMSPSDTETDYGDFRYQHSNSTVTIRQSLEDFGNTRVQTVTPIDPLAGAGGLDVNEVAELVRLQIDVIIEYEDETANQDVATFSEIRGAVGINLPDSQSAFLDNANYPQEDGTVVSARGISEDNVNPRTNTNTNDRILQPFATTGSPPHDGDTSPGSGGYSNVKTYTLNYRSLIGRGPVLDSNDELSAAIAVVTGDITIDHKVTVRAHMVWDVAETDDGGRAFSVPR